MGPDRNTLFSVSRFPVPTLSAGIISDTFGGTASAESAAEFYHGKTVTMWIAFDGGGFSDSAMLVGKHLGRHIPGNPEIKFEQMIGGMG